MEIPAACPMRGEVYIDECVVFTLGGMADALDVPVDVVFERDALCRFIALANGLLAQPAPTLDLLAGTP